MKTGSVDIPTSRNVPAGDRHLDSPSPCFHARDAPHANPIENEDLNRTGRAGLQRHRSHERQLAVSRFCWQRRSKVPDGGDRDKTFDASHERCERAVHVIRALSSAEMASRRAAESYRCVILVDRSSHASAMIGGMTDGPYSGPERRRRPPPPADVFPTPQAIAQRAYELFVSEGFHCGANECWRRAERELLDRAAHRLIRWSRSPAISTARSPSMDG